MVHGYVDVDHLVQNADVNPFSLYEFNRADLFFFFLSMGCEVLLTHIYR